MTSRLRVPMPRKTDVIAIAEAALNRVKSVVLAEYTELATGTWRAHHCVACVAPRPAPVEPKLLGKQDGDGVQRPATRSSRSESAAPFLKAGTGCCLADKWR